MKNIKMIVTDLDGTYLRTDKTISEYSRKIITECRNKGLLFIIATARPIRAVKDFLSESDYDGAIFHNGAVVKLGDEPFSGFGIPNPGKIISILQDAHPGLHVSVEMQDRLYVTFDPGNIWEGIEYTLTDFTDLPFGEADKLLLEAASVEDMKRYEPLLPQDLYIQLSENTVAMIMNKKAEKMRAVKEIAAHYQIDPEEIVAFGDDYNDMEMLQGCGIGVAMENAIDDVKRLADEVCADNDADGVAGWLEQHILNAAKEA